MGADTPTCNLCGAIGGAAGESCGWDLSEERGLPAGSVICAGVYVETVDPFPQGPAPGSPEAIQQAARDIRDALDGTKPFEQVLREAKDGVPPMRSESPAEGLRRLVVQCEQAREETLVEKHRRLAIEQQRDELRAEVERLRAENADLAGRLRATRVADAAACEQRDALADALESLIFGKHSPASWEGALAKAKRALHGAGRQRKAK